MTTAENNALEDLMAVCAKENGQLYAREIYNLAGGDKSLATRISHAIRDEHDLLTSVSSPFPTEFIQEFLRGEPVPFDKSIGILLPQFFKTIGLCDNKEITSADISSHFDNAMKKNSDTCGFDPVNVPSGGKFIDVLRNNPSFESTSVVAVSVGGTNSVVASGAVSGDDGINADDYDKKDLKEDGPIVCKTEREFWDAILPKRFIEIVKAKPSSDLAFTLGFPLDENGCVVSFSDKFVCPSLGPKNLDDAKAHVGGYKPLLSSLIQYLALHDVKKDPKEITISPNDTYSGTLAFVNEMQGNKIGLFIDGTGSNAYFYNGDRNLSVNTELGVYQGFGTSFFDRAISSGILDFESMVSGKMMTETFKFIIRGLFGADDEFSKKVVDDIDKRGTEYIFSMANIPETQTGEDICKLVAKQMLGRAASYIAKMLVAMGDYAGMGDTPFYAEGSLVTKNPNFVREINLLAGREVLKVVSLKLGKTDDAIRKKFDASLAGTFYLAAANRLTHTESA